MSTGREILSDFFQEEHNVFINFFKAPEDLEKLGNFVKL